MKKAKFNIKSVNWGGIIGVVLIVVLAVGVIAGISAVQNDKTKTISSTEFSVGGVDINGIYAPDVKDSIYTANLIKCDGLTVSPDFEATGTFQVFYYGPDEKFVGSSPVLQASDGKYERGTAYPFAKYARVMITPDLTSSDSDNIPFYDVLKHAVKYTVEVNKSQDYKYEDSNVLQQLGGVTSGIKLDSVVPGDDYDTLEASGWTLVAYNVNAGTERYKKVDIIIKKISANVDVQAVITDLTVIDEGEVRTVTSNGSEYIVITFSIKEHVGKALNVAYNSDSIELYVIEYN